MSEAQENLINNIVDVCKKHREKNQYKNMRESMEEIRIHWRCKKNAWIKCSTKSKKKWQKRIELLWKRLSSSHNKDPKWYRDKENRVNHSKRTASRKESNNRREN